MLDESKKCLPCDFKVRQIELNNIRIKPKQVLPAVYDAVTTVLISTMRKDKRIELWEQGVDVIKIKNQWRPIALARQIAAYLFYTECFYKHKAIGKLFKQDRTTSYNSVWIVSEMLNSKHDNEYKRVISLIKKVL